MVNKSRNGVSSTAPVQDDQGGIVVNENDIRQEWTRYYQKLLPLGGALPVE